MRYSSYHSINQPDMHKRSGKEKWRWTVYPNTQEWANGNWEIRLGEQGKKSLLQRRTCKRAKLWPWILKGGQLCELGVEKEREGRLGQKESLPTISHWALLFNSLCTYWRGSGLQAGWLCVWAIDRWTRYCSPLVWANKLGIKYLGIFGHLDSPRNENPSSQD